MSESYKQYGSYMGNLGPFAPGTGLRGASTHFV